MNRKDDSMSRKSKNYSPEFRAKIAEAAIRGDKTINEVAKQFGVSPQMVLKMKARLKERMVELFQDGRSRKKGDEREVTHEELFEEIGRLKVENDWLKKNLPGSVETRRSMIDPGDESLSVSRQCEFAGLSRSTFYFRPQGDGPENLRLTKVIDRYHMDYPAFGSRQIAHEFGIGRGRARRLMRNMGISARSSFSADQHPSGGTCGLPLFAPQC